MIWITITGIVFALIIVVGLCLTPRFSPKLYRRLLFSPQPYSAQDYKNKPVAGVAPCDLFFRTKSGLKIHAWYFQVEGASHCVLLSHGNAGNISQWAPLASFAIKNGMSCLVYDYRGYGLSEGLPTPRGICEDGLAAFDYLTDVKKFSPENIVLFGISMGSGVSCHIAKHRKHSGLILECAYSVFRKLTSEVKPITRFVPAIFFFKQPLNNLRIVKTLKTPKLILHGANDDLIVVDHAHELFEHAHEPKELVILPNGGHCDYGLEDYKTYSQALHQFLAKFKPATAYAS